MLLEEFLRKSGIKKKAFAESIGISPTNLWKILKKIHQPSLQTAQKIEQITEEQVTMHELLDENSKGASHSHSSFAKRISHLEERMNHIEKHLDKPFPKNDD